ncbi:serine hydrolase domain-containing protein [Xanthovirga aplysinae]|uniref:serine hydrolase domain-containing protein n=1 Tax=Xanthovirga aplysinae TaxID=2529853 RepID=UPI0012BC494C|nr:serine hydrolase domain-containing protein [Xanthovirga aplysinae]MTI32656.1 serine hydrolase [Xanthovirga aplysinae]
MKQTLNLLLKTFILGIFFQMLILPLSVGQSKTHQIDKLISQYNEYGQFNGSVLVTEKGKIIFKKGFGMANMEWDIPNRPDTKHRLGSITKQFTAMLIVQLAAEGKIDLHEPISTYLPDYPKPNGNKVTIHHLLTHSSGIPSYTSFPNFFKDISRDPYSPNEFVQIFADSTLQFAPGEKFIYNNSGYFLLGVIIEKITGKPYEVVLQEKIFNPLKMNNTGYDHHNVIMKNRASAYEKDGSFFINAPYLDMSIPYAAGSMYSTVEDLFLWDQALYTDQLLPKKYLDLIFTPYIEGFEQQYGYGWMIGKTPIGQTTDSLQVIAHGGGINGFHTLITRIPSEKSSIILLNNTGRAPLDEMTTAITGILYNKPYKFPKKSIAYSLLEVLLEKGIKSALLHYQEIKDSDTYGLIEDEMNRMGYHLLQKEKVKEAEVLFKLNVEAFPKSWNVYDSYAEVLMVQGKNDKAIKNYKKSIELNPANQNGKEMLKKLGVNSNEWVKK